MGTQPIWYQDRLSQLLEQALTSIDDMDDSGVMAEVTDKIRDEVKDMNLDARNRTSLFYTTDTGTRYLIDGIDLGMNAIKSMPKRDRIFLMAMISMLAEELT